MSADLPTVDLSNVHRTSDGRLMVKSFKMGLCGACPHLHFDLKDEAGNVFATAVIGSDDGNLWKFAAQVCELADALESSPSQGVH